MGTGVSYLIWTYQLYFICLLLYLTLIIKQNKQRKKKEKRKKKKRKKQTKKERKREKIKQSNNQTIKEEIYTSKLSMKEKKYENKFEKKCYISWNKIFCLQNTISYFLFLCIFPLLFVCLLNVYSIKPSVYSHFASQNARGGIRTRAFEKNCTWNNRLKPLGHSCLYTIRYVSEEKIHSIFIIVIQKILQRDYDKQTNNHAWKFKKLFVSINHSSKKIVEKCALILNCNTFDFAYFKLLWISLLF